MMLTRTEVTDMAQPQTPTAAERVLLLPELLEWIIYHLPIRNIYGGRRVCKIWNEVVETSVMLREKMFLVQETGDPRKPVRHTPGLAVVTSPQPAATVSASGLYHFSEPETPSQKVLDLLRDPNTPHERIMNPILKELAKQIKDNPTTLPDFWARAEASWRSMFISSCTPGLVKFGCPELSCRRSMAHHWILIGVQGTLGEVLPIWQDQMSICNDLCGTQNVWLEGVRICFHDPGSTPATPRGEGVPGRVEYVGGLNWTCRTKLFDGP
jgi:hypothetical protein